MILRNMSHQARKVVARSRSQSSVFRTICSFLTIAVSQLTALVLLPTSLVAAEVAACNADGVKNAVVMGQYKKIQNAAGNLLDGASPGSPAASLKTELSRWTMKIENVRQTGYDTTNNIRYCAAEIIHTNYPEMTVLTLGVAGDLKPPCRHNLIYKIEFLLDKQIDWITSGCQD